MTKIVNVVYGVVVLLFLLDGFTGFDIKSQFLKSSVYFIFVIGAPFILLWNLIALETIRWKIVGITPPIACLVLIIIAGPLRIFGLSGAWRTQTVLYEHGHFGFKRVEFQMLDIGARGYNKREVEVIYLTPLFMFTSVPPDYIDKKAEWIKVDRDVNELELKSP
jgi:hypothetical protein